MKRSLIVSLFLLSGALLPRLHLYAEEKVDLSIIHQIKQEAFQNSKVMENLFYLTDVYGPRLAGSPGYKAAGDWAMGRLKEYGLVNLAEEPFPFGRGWWYSKFSANLKEPSYAPLIGFPLAWTPGTDGVVSGEPILAVIRTEADFDKFKGKLKGKIIMVDQPRPLALQTTVPAKRYSDADLAGEALAPDPAQPAFGPSVLAGPIPPQLQQYLDSMRANQPRMNMEQMRAFRNKLNQFLKDEGVALVVSAGQRNDGGTIFAAAGGSREAKDPVPPPSIVLAAEHYNRICRLIEKKQPARLEVEVQAKFYDEPTESFNVVGEIPGGGKKDEVVMLGGHLDSWHGGTGASDNATGVSVAIEAVRILKALNVKLDRTVRIGLWGAEEEGLIGSREYVKAHFADRETMKVKPEHARLAAYFNYDNGGGKIRGIYAQGNDMIKPIFDAWLTPFHDLGATTVTIRNTSGTDHLSFDAVGLPGFQFVQDPLEYGTRTHHSNMDVYDHMQAGDLMQSSAIMASFVYNAATRAEMMPRKPLPKPGQGRGEGGRRQRSE